MELMVVDLDTESAPDYLRSRGLVGSRELIVVTPLGGGISNVVLRVDRSEGESLVLKQALPRLRVAAEWRIDRRRASTEHRCLRYLDKLLPEGCVPRVVFADDDSHLFAMTLAPQDGENWKDLLLSGDIDIATATRAGELLGWLHAEAANSEEARAAFADTEVFVQARVDPYHRVLAARRPELAKPVLAEAERLLAPGVTLVLGDYSPKNIIAYSNRILVLDLEVAHWGDPSFDVAFMLTHLSAKALVCQAAPAERFVQAAQAFWCAYLATIGPLAVKWDIEAHVVLELGCLLAARVDGKSPLEYLDESGRAVLRNVAGRILLDSPPTLDAAFEIVAASRPESGTARDRLRD
jgi:5-methylthioribose kinase